VMDKKRITLEQVAGLMNQYVVVGLDGKPYYGYVEYHIENGRTDNFLLKQRKKVKNES